MLPLMLALTVACPVAWFVSEFQSRIWLRVLLGCCAIAVSFGVASLVGMLQQLNYNAWYGYASKELVETTTQQLEAGNSSEVLKNLRWLSSKYEPTYENRARYDELVGEYTRRFDKSN